MSTDGRVLTIEAFRDKCGGLAKVTSDETGEAVFIYALRRNHGSCLSPAIRQQMTVRLHAPLGKRVLSGCNPNHIPTVKCR